MIAQLQSSIYCFCYCAVIAAATASFWTYAIFMKRTNGAVRVGTLIPIGNNCISFLCGMIMFSCVFSVLLRLNYSSGHILDIIGDNGPANTGLTFIWQCVYVCMWVHVCACVCASVSMYAFMCVHACAVCMCVCTCVCVCVYVCMCILCMCVCCVHVNTRVVCVCACVYVCMRVYAERIKRMNLWQQE